MKKTKKNFLILLDLDGTTLRNDGIRIHPQNIKTIQKLKKQGHTICICSGRPIRSSLNAYRQLRLETLLVSNNGALIVQPVQYDFIVKKISSVDKNVLKEIINNENIMKQVKSVLVEMDNTPYMSSLSDILYEEFHVGEARVVHVGDLNKMIFSKNNELKEISCVLIETHETWNVLEITSFLEQYVQNNLITYRLWPKIGKLSMVIDITNKLANKAEAGKFLCEYYQINPENVIAFGDSSNDYEMIKWAQYGIKMKNSMQILENIGTDFTELDNDNGGVSQYLEKFFK